MCWSGVPPLSTRRVPAGKKPMSSERAARSKSGGDRSPKGGVARRKAIGSRADITDEYSSGPPTGAGSDLVGAGAGRRGRSLLTWWMMTIPAAARTDRTGPEIRVGTYEPQVVETQVAEALDLEEPSRCGEPPARGASIALRDRAGE